MYSLDTQGQPYSFTFKITVWQFVLCTQHKNMLSSLILEINKWKSTFQYHSVSSYSYTVKRPYHLCGKVNVQRLIMFHNNVTRHLEIIHFIFKKLIHPLQFRYVTYILLICDHRYQSIRIAGWHSVHVLTVSQPKIVSPNHCEISGLQHSVHNTAA